MTRTPIRLLTAVPICDGHDGAINTINLELIRHGVEVIYLGYNRSAKDIVRAAIQEDVRAIGISSYNGGHVEFFSDVIQLLRRRGAAHIGVFGGGGGTISSEDARIMQRQGVDRIFFAGTSLDEMMKYIVKSYGPPQKLAELIPRGRVRDRDLQLSLKLRSPKAFNGKPSKPPLTIGITGPGGAGKTTLIDELALRVLSKRPKARIAILSHDPSIVGNGALLGDRATMINSQDDRVFMRSLATRGTVGGMAAATKQALGVLKDVDGPDAFDVIFVETVGIGQEAAPFARGLVDKIVLVMSSSYGSRLQLQKIVMLDLADAMVVNKSDLAGAKTAQAELRQRLGEKDVIATIASRHRDSGVDRLFDALQLGGSR